MEIHHAINGKTHYFDWAIFNSYVELEYDYWLSSDKTSDYKLWTNQI